MRTCRICGKDFEPSVLEAKQGRLVCRCCRSAQTSSSRSKGKSAEASRRYYQNCKNDPREHLKLKTRYATRDAVKAGKLVKEPCAVCGAVQVEAHHRDYSKPLEVIWLCRDHHGELHRREQWASARAPLKFEIYPIAQLSEAA